MQILQIHGVDIFYPSPQGPFNHNGDLSTHDPTVTVDVERRTLTVEGSWPLGKGLDRLLEQHRRGELEPIDVPLETEKLPAHYCRLRALADFCALALGLSLQVADFDEIPLSGRYVAAKMGWMAGGYADGKAGWSSRNAIERYGVIDFGEPREDNKKAGNMCRTIRPPEPLASELGYAPRSLRLVAYSHEEAA